MDFNRKKKSRLIPFAVVFCILYIALSARPSKAELHFTPEWTHDISSTQKADEGEDLIPFRLGHIIGYFTESGKIVSAVPFEFKAAISEKYYSCFDSENSGADFFFKDGTKVGSLQEAGFPFFEDDRIYVMLPGGTSFAKCGDDGKTQWSYSHFAPITAFASSKGGTVAGYADGNLISFSIDGKEDQKFSPGGSSFEVILGVAISQDGNTIACVSGQDRQRFLVAEKKNGISKIIFHEYLDEEISRQTLVKFSKKGDYIYYNATDSLGIVNLKKGGIGSTSFKTSQKIPIKGKISQIEFSSDDSLVFILSNDGEKYTVTVIEEAIYPLGSFSLTGDCAFIQVKGDFLFVGHGTKISKISVSKK